MSTLTPRRARVLGAAALAALVVAGCGGSDKPAASGAAPTPSGAPTTTQAPATTRAPSAGSGFDAVLAKAKGTTVNWYMYGGDDDLNTFVNGYLATRLKARGVTLNQVKITDTVDAVNKVLGEKQAGKKSGSVDAIWINGENFATGKQAGLWACGYDKALPNSRYVDFTKPGVQADFGTPVDGCESVWQQANSALVYDSAKLTAQDVAGVPSLFAWAKAHPGRFTYPAPPDFTGSMAVRTFLYDQAKGPQALSGAFDKAKYTPFATALWKRLNDLEPALYRQGKTYPAAETEVEKLYGDGQLDAFVTYGPGDVAGQVAKGVFPKTTREAVLSVGNISNYSFLAIPANAGHAAAAQVLADTLLDPAVQLELYKAKGVYPGIDLTRAPAAVQQAFRSVKASPSVLGIPALTAHAQPELQADYVTAVEKDWKSNVLQR